MIKPLHGASVEGKSDVPLMSAPFDQFDASGGTDNSTDLGLEGADPRDLAPGGADVSVDQSTTTTVSDADEQYQRSVADRLAEISSLVGQLAAKDERENKMYEDLQVLKKADDVKRSMPLFRSVIQIVDRISEMRRQGESSEDSLLDVQDELVELLERHGIEMIDWTDSDVFDGRYQKAVGQLEETASVDLVIVSPAYVYQEQVIRHQHVMVKSAARTEGNSPLTAGIEDGVQR
jgi:molecular chaperone GrpE (heat shock protein)